MAVRSASCFARVARRWARMYSWLPMGVPSTVTPCSAGGVSGPPTQSGGASGGAGGQAVGEAPLAFHMRVLPWCNVTLAWRRSACSRCS